MQVRAYAGQSSGRPLSKPSYCFASAVRIGCHSPTAQTFIVDGTWSPYAYMAAGHIEETYRWPYETAIDALNEAAQATHPVAA